MVGPLPPPNSLPAGKPESAEQRKRRLENLSKSGQASKEIRDELVRPLRTTVTLGPATLGPAESLERMRSATPTARGLESSAESTLPPGLRSVSRNLGLTGSILGGVAGLNEVVQGINSGDDKRLVAGATDMTVSASAMASMGVIGGGAALLPAGGILLGMRGLGNLENPDRGRRLSGLSDLVLSATMISRVLGGPVGVTLGLGITATSLGMVAGLNHLKQGQESGDARRKLRGLGSIMASAGVALVATGLGVVPGVGLALVGSTLPLLQRVKPLRKPINQAVEFGAKQLYPLAQGLDRGLNRLEEAGQPVTIKVKKGLSKAKEISAPVTEPLQQLGRTVRKPLQNMARSTLTWLASTSAMHYLDAVAGKVNGWLLPADENNSATSLSKP